MAKEDKAGDDHKTEPAAKKPAAPADQAEPASGPSRAQHIHHALARIRGNVSTARKRLDLHALADAVTELLDLLDASAAR